MTAEDYLNIKGIPNFEWSAMVNYQGEVKEGMEFPNSMSKIMEAYAKHVLDQVSEYVPEDIMMQIHLTEFKP